jgi:hypothetical protein
MLANGGIECLQKENTPPFKASPLSISGIQAREVPESGQRNYLFSLAWEKLAVLRYGNSRSWNRRSFH